MNRQKRTKIAGMTTVKKLTKQSESFDDRAKFDWQPMELFKNRRYLCVSIKVCYNLHKCVLDTLEFTHVKSGLTSEQRITIVRTITNKGICCQDSSIIPQELRSHI